MQLARGHCKIISPLGHETHQSTYSCLQSSQANAILRGCDDATVRSLNGCRVTDTLLGLFKSPEAQNTFRLALRALRHWAAMRGIYSNVMGYFGGINVAILTAKIAQWYPNASASKLVCSFFMVSIQAQDVQMHPSVLHRSRVQMRDCRERDLEVTLHVLFLSVMGPSFHAFT